jgi:two-component system, chemotaxis family, chemotaxis protein CheY
MKVLIVDDSMFIRILIKQALDTGGFKPLEIKEAGNAEDALPLLREFKPDMMILDLNLPGMSGMELIEAVKKEGLKIKYGVVTSNRDQAVNQKAKEAGAAFFIAKPFTKNSFLDALKGSLS